jgi:glyoxalase family protein
MSRIRAVTTSITSDPGLNSHGERRDIEMTKLLGLHHVTAITGSPQANIDFYTGVLGLRLVKITVNFDDPKSYHLYYGDKLGRPGTVLTFFAWPGARAGKIGASQIIKTGFSVESGSLPAWETHFDDHSVKHSDRTSMNGKQSVELNDPDGMTIELVDAADSTETAGSGGRLAVQRIRGITLAEPSPQTTTDFLSGVLGFERIQSAGGGLHYTIGEGEARASVEITTLEHPVRPALGAGIIHHVAWRVSDDASQAAWLDQLRGSNNAASPVMDRSYFHSIYFNEPGGVLFEIATDNPGFAVDEAVGDLGTSLCLPPWLVPHRAEIEANLPRLRLPGGDTVGSI